jgi:hypothetical protein
MDTAEDPTPVEVEVEADAMEETADGAAVSAPRYQTGMCKRQRCI